MLQLCISQEITNKPYTFKATGIRVFSIEEALYHAYHYWRESVDEFLSHNLSDWVASLGHSNITAKMKDVTALKPLSKRLLAFLNIIEYFNESELAKLKADLAHWENRVEWEKLKDRADNLESRGEPAKALPLYGRALSYEENIPLLNNMAIANMQLSNHREAVKLLAKARAAEPENMAINLHYAEAAILNGDYEDAKKALEKVSAYHSNAEKSSSSRETADILYLHGLMAYQQKDYSTALNSFNQAVAQNPNESHYTYKIADVYMHMRQYDKALDILKQSPGGPHHIKMAEVYAAYGHAHMPEAIRHIRQAISQGGPNEAALWTKLAEYYRKDYDCQRADNAITNALPSKSVAALLENARIKKGLGRMREYRAGLSEALKGLKERYREGG